MTTVLTTPEDATALAAHALAPGREQPLVCVTISAGHAHPFVDVERLHRDLEGLADVAVMPTGAVAWAFHDALPPQTDVYGGATRIYPPSWDGEPAAAPVIYAYGPQERPRSTDRIVRIALGMVRQAPRPVVALQDAPAGGHVLGVAGGRGLVDLSEGATGQATIWPELVADTTAEQLLTKDMPVWGLLDHQTRRLDVTCMRLDPTTALAGYHPDDTVLARVADTGSTRALLELWPGVHATLTATDVLPGQDVPPSDALTTGEVVAVRLTSTTPDPWTATLTSTTDPLPAPPILEGGPPWLTAPLDEPAAPSEDPAGDTTEQWTPPEAPTPGAPADDPTTAALRLERDDLAERLRRADDDLRRERATSTRLRTQLRQAREREARIRSDADRALIAQQTLTDDLARFADPEQQLRFEVDLAWARRTSRDEKPDLPLTAWSLGPDFLTTLEQTQGVDRAKVIDVIVDVLTGRAAQLTGRDLHQLRTSIAGDAPPVTRADGATCWRVSLQTKTPSSRRLHYYLSRDGRHIELSSIRLHDDIRP